MAKVSAKLVVGVLAALGIFTGSGIWVSRVLMPGSDLTQAKTPHYTQLGQDMSNTSGMMEHNMSGSDMSDMEHGTTSGGQTGLRATAQLSVKSPVSPGQSFPLAIIIKEAKGQPVEDFQTSQEKLMHLIVVSNDLGFFEHIHPNFTGTGRFDISTALPHAGSYTLFSDFKPVGMREQVVALPLRVAGSHTSTRPQVGLARTKTVGSTRVNLSLSNPTIQPTKQTTPVAGQEVKVTFDLIDTTTGRPISNLQPYLGAGGHLVILRQEPQLTAGSYIHAHALPLWGTKVSSSIVSNEHSGHTQLASATSSAPGQVTFLVTFPKAGRYKLWGQFSRGGEIMTANFWVNVNS